MLALLLMASPASAKVYMCIDPDTGRKSFTDKACDTPSAYSEEVRVDRANLQSGKTYSTNTKKRRIPAEKAWTSQRDTRKSGRELNAQKRSAYSTDATAQVN